MNNVFLTKEEIEHPYADLRTMIEDKRKKAEQMRRTVFARITASPEVLAEKLVYEAITCDGDGHVLSGYRSTIIQGFWLSKSEAIAATVAKLKEVENA